MWEGRWGAEEGLFPWCAPPLVIPPPGIHILQAEVGEDALLCGRVQHHAAVQPVPLCPDITSKMINLHLQICFQILTTSRVQSCRGTSPLHIAYNKTHTVYQLPLLKVEARVFTEFRQYGISPEFFAAVGTSEALPEVALNSAEFRTRRLTEFLISMIL